MQVITLEALRDSGQMLDVLHSASAIKISVRVDNGVTSLWLPSCTPMTGPFVIQDGQSVTISVKSNR